MMRKELLGFVVFTCQFRHNLLVSQFIVRIAHNSFRGLLNFRNLEGQLPRWLGELSQYHIVIQHRPGARHTNADTLSHLIGYI